jgi:hypothetical protein
MVLWVSAAGAWLRARLITRGIGGSLAGNDPIHPLPIAFFDSSLGASFLRTTTVKNPAPSAVAMIVAMVAPPGRRSRLSTRVCFEFALLWC